MCLKTTIAVEILVMFSEISYDRLENSFIIADLRLWKKLTLRELIVVKQYFFPSYLWDTGCTFLISFRTVILRVPQTSSTDVTWELVRSTSVVVQDQEFWGRSLAIAVSISPPGDSDGCSSVRTTFLYYRNKEFKYNIYMSSYLHVIVIGWYKFKVTIPVHYQHV